ncbi:MAG: hypothetical protein KUL75_03220 [Sterolibacterium sp.]|nr:hypothetical protein [Sterolibacterium sp.]
MSAQSAREAHLATVLKSPAAVAAHDKAAWLDIFGRFNIVEDPVGSPPHVSGVFDAGSGVCGKGPLARFYDCFIAPSRIVFHVDQDIVCGSSVVRDLNMEVGLSDKVTIRVPMHAHYELMEEAGELKVLHLAAHWELAPMLRQQMSFGLASLSCGLALGGRMVRQLGLLGTLGFMSAAFNIGQAGKLCVARFVEAFNQKDFSAARMGGLLSSDFVGVAWPANQPPAALDRLASLPGQLQLGKTLASGNYITASFVLKPDAGGQALSGVAFFEFNMHEKKLQRIRFFVES